MFLFYNGFYILLTFILLGASAEPFPSFLFSSFAWISRFLWVSQKIKEFFRMPSVGVKDVDQQKFTVALAAFLKKSGKVSHLNFALLNRIFRQTYQTVMAAILRDVAAIGTVPGFQRRSRSSTEPILACWFLILLDYSMKSCRRNWDFEFVLASLRYSHLNSFTGQVAWMGGYGQDQRCQGARSLRWGLVLRQIGFNGSTHLREISSRCHHCLQDLWR